MSKQASTIDSFLAGIKEKGQSSPAGHAWQQFYEFLANRKGAAQSPPPVPLILAASGESSASKHRRLASQLAWASEGGILQEALHYLETLSDEKWDTSPLDRWNKDSYWK
jgi:hypothetical protein